MSDQTNLPEKREEERFSVELLRWLSVLALALIVIELAAKQVTDLMEVL